MNIKKSFKNSIFYIFFLLLLSQSSLAEVKPTKLSDGEIIGIYNQVNSFDIETALLAMTKGSSEKVKKLAALVSTDHRGVRLKAAELGVKVILPVFRQVSALNFYKKINELSETNGEAFDRLYLLNEIQFHTKAMEAVKNTLLPAADSKELQEHFKTVLPHFKHHLAETIKVRLL
jgi:putative membrane protein